MFRRAAMGARRALTSGVAIAAMLTAGCMTGTVQVDRGPRPIPVGPPGWDIQTREHLDLWLHGYALVQADTGALTLFRPRYAEEMRALRDSLGVFTLLDANADRLAPRFAENPALVNGHFAPLYFASWADLREGVDALLRSNGDPRRAGGGRRAVLILSQMFPTAADRDWLRTFVLSLEDERARFYQAHWEERQRRSVMAFAAADSALRAAQAAGLRRYVLNAALNRGTVLLSLPLAGEGRSVLDGVERPLVAVGHPLQPENAATVVYTFAHEVVGPAVAVAIREFDGTLPAGLTADAYTTIALVRAGHRLLERAAPELAPGYARYYLGLIGRTPGANPAATLAAAFPLPEALAAAIFAQVDEVWTGI